MISVIFKNFGWKVLSLGFAILLWTTFVGSPELVTPVSAPVEFQNMPQNLELSSGMPGRVYLEIQGPSARLHSLDLSRTAVVLNLSSVYRPGERTFTIERHNIDLPTGLDLVRVVPSQVRLVFERRMQAEVPVRVRFAGPPPAGYRIGRQDVQPATLQIIGPESQVRQVAFAETDPIEIARIAGSAEFHVQTFVANPQVRPAASPVVEVKLSLEKTN